MFYSITGTVVAVEESAAAISCAGVAFRCQTSMSTLRRIGSVGAQVTLYTYMSVREDALELFGFDTQEELNCFKMLIAVNGVGPKAAIAILSEMTPDRLALCIAAGDAKQIRKAPGIGPKLAQRIVLELKDKVSRSIDTRELDLSMPDAGMMSASGAAAEAVSALEVLGYSRQEASAAVAKADETLSVEDKIKFALKLLARG